MADINVNQLTQVTTVPESTTLIPVANKGTNAGNVISVEDLKKQIVNPGFGVGEHNRFRGKNLGTSFTTTQSTNIVNGSFEDLYVGDYWTIANVTYRIAGVDCVYNRGDTALNKHHLVIVPDKQLYTHQMCHTESGGYVAGAANNTTEGGYANSYGRTTGLTAAETTIVGAFGDAHVLSYRDYLSNAVTDGTASAGAWTDCRIELMSEMMVYGSCIRCAPSTQEVGIFTFQLPLFAQAPYYINFGRQALWLRSVVSAQRFASVHNSGFAYAYSASYAYGIRPLFLIA